MLKREMAKLIATALYPANFRSDSPAIKGEIESLMKSSKKELEAQMYGAEKVHEQRKSVVFSAPYKDDEWAEWHPMNTLACKEHNLYGNPQFFCPVCGEVYPNEYLSYLNGVECGDCKLGIAKQDNYVIIYELDPSNPVPSFYDRERN